MPAAALSCAGITIRLSFRTREWKPTSSGPTLADNNRRMAPGY